jgi:rhamnosyltransferase
MWKISNIIGSNLSISSILKLMQTKNINIAVLLASHNGSAFIQEQISSILSQKNINVDLFISDDASSDDTLKIIKKNKNVQLISNKKRGGPAENFYFLIKNLKVKNYDFIALSDQDDIWPLNRLERAVSLLKIKNCDAYSSDVIAFNKTNNNLKLIKKSYPQKKYDYFFETPGPGCSFILSKSFFSFLQYFLKTNKVNFIYHDWLIYAVARHHKFNWFIDDCPNLYYRQHENNYIGANSGFRARVRRLNRILFGDYYKELIALYYLLNRGEKKLNFLKVFAFLINFNHTRRKFHHAILMIPFLLIVSIQRNEI